MHGVLSRGFVRSEGVKMAIMFDEVVWEADRRGLLSDEHFSVDGTLIEAVARHQELPTKG